MSLPLYFPAPHIELDLPSNWVWQWGNNRINTRSCGMVAWYQPKWNRTKTRPNPISLTPLWPVSPLSDLTISPNPGKGSVCEILCGRLRSKDVYLASQVCFEISILLSLPVSSWFPLVGFEVARRCLLDVEGAAAWPGLLYGLWAT